MYYGLRDPDLVKFRNLLKKSLCMIEVFLAQYALFCSAFNCF